jgi:diacylglycerol kinase (ATP)
MEGNRLLEQVVRSLQDKGMEVDVALARPNEEAIPIARKALKDGYRVFVAIGGDDTVWSVMRGLAGSKAKLGIIAGGTENNTARTLGIPEDDPEAACALIAAGKTRKIDLGEVWKTRRGKKSKRLVFCELVTAGIGAELYPSVKDVPKGDFSKVKDAVQAVFKHPVEPKVFLTLDDESKVKVNTMLVTVANFPIIGAHMLVAPDASLTDGLLDVAVYPEFTKPQLMAYFAQVREEGVAASKITVDESKVQRYRIRELKIKAQPKMAVLADGVELGKGAVKLRVLKAALRVFAPPVGTGTEAPRRDEVKEMPAPVGPSVDPQQVKADMQGRNGTEEKAPAPPAKGT